MEYRDRPIEYRVYIMEMEGSPNYFRGIVAIDEDESFQIARERGHQPKEVVRVEKLVEIKTKGDI